MALVENVSDAFEVVMVVNMSRMRRKPTMNELQHHHASGCSHFLILPTAGKYQLRMKRRLPTLLGQF